MPIGVYKRTKWHIEIACRNLEKAKGVPRKYPISEKQLKACRENQKKAVEAGRKLPRTEAHRKAARENMLKCHKEGKHLGHGFGKKPRTGQTIIRHHNDLQHGAERPDDVTYMSHSEHVRLHSRLQLEDGTHNFLTKNKRKNHEQKN